MKNDSDILKTTNIVNDLGHTDVGEQLSERSTFCTLLLPKFFEENQKKTIDEVIENSDDDLQGQGSAKTVIPSNIIDIYNRLEVLLGLRLSGHTNALTEASNLIDEL